MMLSPEHTQKQNKHRMSEDRSISSFIQMSECQVWLRRHQLHHLRLSVCVCLLRMIGYDVWMHAPHKLICVWLSSAQLYIRPNEIECGIFSQWIAERDRARTHISVHIAQVQH